MVRQLSLPVPAACINANAVARTGHSFAQVSPSTTCSAPQQLRGGGSRHCIWHGICIVGSNSESDALPGQRAAKAARAAGAITARNVAASKRRAEENP